MPAPSSPTTRDRGVSTRGLLYALLFAFNAFLWLVLMAFHWEISLRAREVEYFGRQLFPLRAQAVPLPVIYTTCAVLSAASLGAILRDRSNLRQRERLQTLLTQILESLDIGVVVLDGRGALSLANESARRLLPEIPAEGSDSSIPDALRQHPEVRLILMAAVTEGNYVKEVEHDLGSGDHSCAVRITTLPLRDRQKRVSGTLLLVHDVREVVAMERQMRTAERLSTLGTLGAALAHEIRNPLEAMNLNLELLERNLDQAPDRTPESGKRRKYVGVFKEEISRLAGVVDNFLSFARPSHSPIAIVPLDEVLRRVVELIENQAKSRRVETTLTVDSPGILVEGSEDQLKQVFLNLIINSLEAMPAGGRLCVQAFKSRPHAADGAAPMATVRIQDTGEGIPQEKLDRLFEPFYSSRPRGTGLGLTIANRVVREHRGRIRVESVPGQGSTFTVELPAAAAEKQRQAL